MGALIKPFLTAITAEPAQTSKINTPTKNFRKDILFSQENDLL